MDVILLGEIQSLIDGVNTKVQAVDTVVRGISTDIGATNATGGTTTAGTVMAKLNAIIGNTATNNTASTTGTISQKISSAISNTAATTTENSSGTLSAKLTYLINRRDRLYVPGSTSLKTVTTSLTSSNTTKSQTSTQSAYSDYTAAVYPVFNGTYRIYCTATTTVVSLGSKNGYAASKKNESVCEVIVNDAVVGSFVVSQHNVSSVGTGASATKTYDVVVKKGDKMTFRIAGRSQKYQTGAACDGSLVTYCTNEVKATCTEISIRGSIKEVSSVFY